MNATMTQNVVTYTVVVTTDNSDGKLLPYLTANVQFEAERRCKVLVAPNAALRWKPQASQIDPVASKANSLASEAMNAPDRGCVWIADGNGLVRPLDVALGASDGMMTEIGGSGAREGLLIVAGEEAQEERETETAEADKTSNPFLPKPPKGSRPPPPPM
jgi:HlyD family secretion protein